ncbi:hypothetical protein GCM10028805_48400 [Spirosoma harenae]
MAIGKNLLLWLAILCISCSAETTTQPTNLTVELDAFSGKPNPTWTLSEAESAEFIAAVKSLPTISDSTQTNKLGYRGFLLSTSKGADGLPSRIRVYRKIIRVESTPPQSFQDINGLERRLKQQASQRGYSAVLDSL